MTDDYIMLLGMKHLKYQTRPPSYGYKSCFFGSHLDKGTRTENWGCQIGTVNPQPLVRASRNPSCKFSYTVIRVMGISKSQGSWHKTQNGMLASGSFELGYNENSLAIIMLLHKLRSLTIKWELFRSFLRPTGTFPIQSWDWSIHRTRIWKPSHWRLK